MAANKNELTLLNRIKTLLLARVWDGAGAVKVFGTGSVIISAGIPVEALGGIRTPAAWIRPGSGDHDDEDPELIKIRFTVTVLVAVPGDHVGEHAFIGAGFTAGAPSGQGVLEIGEQVLLTISALHRDDSIPIQSVGRGNAEGALDRETNYVGYRDYIFEAWVGTET